jgi:hypothetical protein
MMSRAVGAIPKCNAFRGALPHAGMGAGLWPLASRRDVQKPPLSSPVFPKRQRRAPSQPWPTAGFMRDKFMTPDDEPRRWRCPELQRVPWGAAPRWDGGGPLALGIATRCSETSTFFPRLPKAPTARSIPALAIGQGTPFSKRDRAEGPIHRGTRRHSSFQKPRLLPQKF